MVLKGNQKRNQERFQQKNHEGIIYNPNDNKTWEPRLCANYLNYNGAMPKNHKTDVFSTLWQN